MSTLIIEGSICVLFCGKCTLIGILMQWDLALCRWEGTVEVKHPLLELFIVFYYSPGNQTNLTVVSHCLHMRANRDRNQTLPFTVTDNLQYSQQLDWTLVKCVWGFGVPDPSLSRRLRVSRSKEISVESARWCGGNRTSPRTSALSRPWSCTGELRRC